MSMKHYSQMLYQLSYAPIATSTKTSQKCTFVYINTYLSSPSSGELTHDYCVTSY